MSITLTTNPKHVATKINNVTKKKRINKHVTNNSPGNSNPAIPNSIPQPEKSSPYSKQSVRKTIKMGVGRFNANPRKVPRRILMLSEPKKSFLGGDDGMPTYTKLGTRTSALRGQLTNSDIAWPHLRCLLNLKRMYRKRFSEERLQKLDQMIEAANATMYSKLASCTIDLKKQEKESKKSKAWSPAEWKKHMDHISQIAAPKKVFEPRPMKRGNPVPLETLLPRLNMISSRPDFKCYKKESEEPWYKDPQKVSPSALKYQITERTRTLAKAKVTQTDY